MEREPPSNYYFLCEEDNSETPISSNTTWEWKMTAISTHMGGST